MPAEGQTRGDAGGRELSIIMYNKVGEKKKHDW